MKKNVWIIDDDEGILEVIQLLFEQERIKGEYISQPLKVLDLLEKESTPSLIFIDIFMSGLNGVELAKQIKKNSKTQNIPIILMSADPAIADKVKLAHADGYLEKPFDSTDILDIVNKFGQTQLV